MEFRFAMVQATLFDDPVAQVKSDPMMKVMDAINREMGAGKSVSGCLVIQAGMGDEAREVVASLYDGVERVTFHQVKAKYCSGIFFGMANGIDFDCHLSKPNRIRVRRGYFESLLSHQ